MDFAGGLLGSDVEVKDFDPLGLSKDKSDETLAYYRAAELKHGRVCMLAVSSMRTTIPRYITPTLFYTQPNVP